MEQLFVLITLVQRTYGKWLLHQLFASMMILTILVLVTSIIASAAVLVGLYAVYHVFITPVADAEMALILLFIASATVATLLYLCTGWYLLRLRRMPYAMLKKSPVTSLATDTVEAFIHGVMMEKK